MPKLTLGDVRSSRIPAYLGMCSDDSRLIKFLNEAEQRLMNLPANFFGTTQNIQLYTDGNLITWPRQVAAVRAIKACGKRATIANQWYSFLGPCLDCDDSCIPGCLRFEMENTSPAFKEISTTGSTLRLYPTNACDIGKQVLLQGYDEFGQWVRTKTADYCASYSWVDGEYLTLDQPYVESTRGWLCGGLQAVQKPETVGDVQLREVLDDGTQIVIGNYEPGETRPDYMRTRLVNPDLSGCGCACVATNSFLVEAIVKLQHIDVLYDTDHFVIGNLPALKDAAKAVQYMENEDFAKAEIHFQSAQRELNRELRNYTSDRTHIRVSKMGGRRPNQWRMK